MDAALRKQWVMAEQDQRIAEAIDLEKARLRNFIRRRVADPSDAEDILQEARNRITDLFRKKKPDVSTNDPVLADDGETLSLEDLLPSQDSGPEAEYARTVLLEELEDALEELPKEQREVFLKHEVEGRSFKELAMETGLSVNTLLSRKHYAVLHLRERLRDVYDEFMKAGG
jgi:DNA-directed RNA polymerase specialized sigma24 family protein